jgi:hypothetical protein
LFSASTFLTNWNKMKPAAKVILFDDPAVRSNLDDIARLSSKRADTMSLANRSNTGVALTGNVAGLGATALANPMAPFALGAAQFLTGQMLANPRIIRSIAKVIKINTPERRAVAVRELQGMAARLPESADQIASLSDYIKGAK